MSEESMMQTCGRQTRLTSTLIHTNLTTRTNSTHTHTYMDTQLWKKMETDRRRAREVSERQRGSVDTSAAEIARSDCH